MHYKTLKYMMIMPIIILGGCATKGPLGKTDYTPVKPITPPPSNYAHGSIYHGASAMSLFQDLRARRVGDLLTVILNERTDASKSASTSTSKETEVSAPGATAFGRPTTRDNVNFAETNISSESAFDGSGSSNQSNQLTGSIAVTIAEVLPNDVYVVQGEKWININQGREYVQLRGLVRGADIGTDNTVLSSQIAASQIGYTGSGTLADANRQGWFSRFFSTVLWPF